MLSRLQDVFRSLQRHEAEYVVIGGIAAILHGVPRTTFGLDNLVEAALENAGRLLDAGLGSATHTTPGISFEDARRNRETVTYPGQDFYILSKTDLIASKRAAGRDVDLQDVRLLEVRDDEGGEE